MSTSAEERQQVSEDDEGSWINEQLLSEIIEEGAVVHSIDKERATGKGDNYMSILYRTRLEYVINDEKEVRVENLIVKGLPPGEFMKIFAAESGVFRRELDMYDYLLPRLYSFANSKLGEGKYFKKFSPEFYRVSLPDTIILRDLKADGFRMASRKDRLDLTHAKLVVQNLARLHALSVTYNEKYPGTIEQYQDKAFSEANRERLTQFLVPIIKIVTDHLIKSGICESIARKMEAVQDNLLSKVFEATNVVNSPRTVLVHGDSWVNNILFKYSETGQPVDLRFVDFQISREASPALDLNYFILTSIRTDVRERHFENLLQEYCDEFERWSMQLGYSGAPFTFEEIQREINRTTPFGFFACMTVLPAILADAEDTPDLENLTEDIVASGNMEEFTKVYTSARFEEVLKSLLPYFDERGVFN